MDPRHPEQAISRMRELMKQYDRIEADMANATTSAKLAQLEREGGLVVQEICLVAPRMHEAMMQASRQRRHDLAHGVVDLGIRTKYEQPFEPVEKPAHKWSSAEKVVEAKEYLEQTIANSDEEKPVEKSAQSVTKQAAEPTQSVGKTEEKPKKKTARKKKPTKKAEK